MLAWALPRWVWRTASFWNFDHVFIISVLNMNHSSFSRISHHHHERELSYADSRTSDANVQIRSTENSSRNATPGQQQSFDTLTSIFCCEHLFLYLTQSWQMGSPRFLRTCSGEDGCMLSSENMWKLWLYQVDASSVCLVSSKYLWKTGLSAYQSIWL